MARIDHEPLTDLRRCTFRLSEPVSTHDMFPFQEVSHCSTDEIGSKDACITLEEVLLLSSNTLKR